MHLTYQELFPTQQNFSHLALTVKIYFAAETPRWWVNLNTEATGVETVAGLWMGNAVDQVTGDRYAQIFLLYVCPPHRGQGIAKSLLQEAQDWAKKRGDRQIGLQVFTHNQAALNLYKSFGFQTQSLSMLKSLRDG